MAPESLFENVSTTSSDVWSFGILAWETYSFGAAPYSHMGIEEAVRAIARGYRLPRPSSCPPEVYDYFFAVKIWCCDAWEFKLNFRRYETLLQCWHESPEGRPKFKALEYILSDLLDEESSL
jgi:hypothetical protein